MIEHGGIRVHLDPKGDRIKHSDFEFDGWVAANRSIAAVWLPAVGSARLTTCQRPDVERVFPGCIAIGFSGKCAERDLDPAGLRIAVQVGDQIVEVQHPVPKALPQPPLVRQLAATLKLAWWQVRGQLARTSSQRFDYTLRRHLLSRRLRGGLFQRRHTDALLADFAIAVPDAVFVQIGANDGFTGDPLNHLVMHPDTRWRGVLVEPVGHLFNKLSERYRHDPALRLERAAIGEKDGTTMIHRLDTAPNDTLWLDQIPSLDATLLQRNAGQFGKSESKIVSEEVPCLTVATLLDRHAISSLDLLVIDTEGWDWRVLRQFDLAGLKPRLVLYEHQHLSPEEREQAEQFLSKQGYEYAVTEEGDTTAWRIL